MKTYRSLLSIGALSSITGVFGRCSAQPVLEKIFTANFGIGAAIQVGQGPYGFRTVAPIDGGTFSGPNINGDTENSA